MTDFKECKAWAVVDKEGHFIHADYCPLVYHNHKDAEFFLEREKGERVMRVRIVRDEG